MINEKLFLFLFLAIRFEIRIIICDTKYTNTGKILSKSNNNRQLFNWLKDIIKCK